MEWLLEAYDGSYEKQIIDSVSREVPWKLVESFSRLKRDSGTEGEREAAATSPTGLAPWAFRTSSTNPSSISAFRMGQAPCPFSFGLRDPL